MNDELTECEAAYMGLFDGEADEIQAKCCAMRESFSKSQVRSAIAGLVRKGRVAYTDRGVRRVR